jgi:glycosyltransferase involved in cell wall biosynthesis
MRKRFIQSHFRQVDLFLAPSRFLRDRYIDWGIPAERIRFEEYGRRRAEPEPPAERQGPRDRFGFFGQINRFKGINVLLEAMSRLREGTSVELRVHGANLELQTDEFQEEFAERLEAAGEGTRLEGRYEHRDLPSLMAGIDWVVVPSVWWENSPLVIQEAFQYGRPVICSDIGGMAEKVDHEVNGLHFRAGDPASLARTLERASTDPGLWKRLREGIRPIYALEDHIEALESMYAELLEPAVAVEAVW